MQDEVIAMLWHYRKESCQACDVVSVPASALDHDLQLQRVVQDVLLE